MAFSKANEFSSELVELSQFAKAIAHPARIQILEHLASRNTCICGDIVNELPLSQSTVSQHLKGLKGCRINTRKGRSTINLLLYK